MKNKRELRLGRRRRIRAKIIGTHKRPRLAIFRSHVALTAQLIDDEKNITIGYIRTLGKNMAAGQTLGAHIAKLAATKHITTVVFDRGGYQYHGVIAAIADEARKGGLTF